MAAKNIPTCSCVMLIDDNEIDNFINQKMIEGCNFSQQVHIHSSSKSALEFLENLARAGDVAKNMIPGVIFLDINMPLMDGFQFLNEFEKLDTKFIKDINIVMLSTSVNPTDIENSEKNKHVVQFLSKPLNEEQLSDLAKKIGS